jgi:starch-binding outer membrane protein, SusD/RagB family
MKTILFVLLLTVGLLACDTFIEAPISSTQIQRENVRTVNELDILMTGAYSGIAREVSFGGNALLIGDLMGDLLAVNNTNFRTAPGRLSRVFFWTHREEDYGAQAEFLQWSTFGLNNSVNVLELLQLNQVQTPGETDPRKDIAKQRDRIEGEARFVRAICVFEQTRLLGYPWGFAPDNTQPGPISSFKSLSTFDELAYPRLSVKAAYDSVLNDLRRAERLLPENYNPAIHPADYQPRANKYAALALMARVYWQQDNMDSVLAVTNRLLGTGSSNRFPLEPGTTMLRNLYQRTGILPTTNSASRNEIIFELVNVSGRNSRTTTGAPIRASYVLQTPYTTAQLANVNTLNAGPNLRLAQRFKELANFDRQRDLRYRSLIDTTQATRTTEVWNSPNRLWFTLKWGSRTAGTVGAAQGVDTNIPLYRSAEFLLMRAEANARKNNTTTALADLNAVRARAGLPALTASADLIAEIRTEYLRETFTEGTRIHDLKRRKETLNPGDRTLSPGGIDCTASGCSPVPWNSRLLVFLIPQTFLDRNPLATQND